MNARPRIDLDGVPLVAEENPEMVIAVFRYRTTRGLQLMIPESADFVVDWAHVENARLDLKSGGIHIRLSDPYASAQNWLRGTSVLVGRWTDRYTKP